MKRFGFAFFAATLALVVCGLQSATAADYPDDQVIPTDTHISLSASTLVGGNNLTITVTVTGEGDPSGELEVEAFGNTYATSNNEKTVKVTTPVVDEETDKTINATFTPDNQPSALGDSTDAVVAAPLGSIAIPSAIFYLPSSDSATVTLLPVGSSVDSSDSSGLPDTGANRNLLTFLLLGFALVAVGGGTVYAVRRRKTT